MLNACGKRASAHLLRKPFVSSMRKVSLVRLKSSSALPPSAIGAPSAPLARAPYRLQIPLSFADNPDAPAAALCITTAGIITVLVSVGGLTRLTKSGLSMVHWSPHKLSPPRTTEEWEVEFEHYKQFPEWQQRKSMMLDDFKFIFYWEWGHRMLGRVVGGVYGAGLAALLVTKKVPKGYHGRLFGLMALGGAQGAVGWWMVKSGLGEDRRGDHREIRVSPYRLAAHLCTAFVTYSGLVWTGLELLYPAADRKQVSANAAKRVKELLAEGERSGAVKSLRRLRAAAGVTTALTFATVASGAFVAGNSAGNAYNDWPLMNGQLFPWTDVMEDHPVNGPFYRKFFENTALVQFDHRMLAYLTSGAVAGTVLTGLKLNAGPLGAGGLGLITPQAMNALRTTGAIAVAQVSLGISTLVMNVPIHLAATHQLGSLALLTSGLCLSHSLRYVGTATRSL
eukprot:CAMPEP_0182466704 /NCGR_PEP_ID=MMETSP1319-20130603/12517_1 /TAXON_ID=172717 /ORGANISM="Bolidomonas pacifica, Strain RCC208" /LENGTH=451 /DNA_ID=CAMNT_0024666731 /DNA_START=196 /DNA_END=1547 /DNA_ORIENTATION=+